LPAVSDFSLIRHHDDERFRLERWRQNVGAPIALDCAATGDAVDGSARSLVVLSWNVWIGRGRLREVISRVRNGDLIAHGADPDAPLVVLLQEAYRSDSTIPRVSSRQAGRVLVAQLGLQEDVVETAQALGLNLRYAPSMRNGASRSDRGNAILSTLPLEHAHAVELPLVLQRRVVVSADITLGGSKLRLVSAHLDPISSVPDETVVLGADLNLGRGRYERAWRLLADAGFTLGVPPSSPPWRHTFHALPRLVLDYLLVRDRAGVIRHARVHRLDEHPTDRGSRVFGSDHHPLLARIDLHPTNGETE
jgi:endonuclease/exonuclease/phosphatase family metal-dependent hydrolase